MRKIAAAVVAFHLAASAALAQTFPGSGPLVNAELFSPHHNFATDDAPALNAAMAAAGPGGAVILSATQPYWLNSSITVPAGVSIGCAAPPQKQLPVGSSYVSLGCALYISPSHPITNNGSIINLRVFQDNIHFAGQPGTSHAVKAITANYASTGTGIINNGFDAIIRDVAIAGFNLCISDQTINRGILQHVLMDCHNGVLFANPNGDTLRQSDLEVVPFYPTTLNGAGGQIRQTITNVANNGSGAWRVTLTAAMPEALVTADEVFVGGQIVLGIPQGALGKHNVTFVDSTHYDLTGSRVAPTLSCTTTTGSPYCTGVSAFTDWWPTMTFTGTCFTGTRAVQMLLPGANALLADANATSTGSCTLTGASSAFSASGTPQLIYDPNDIHGICYEMNTGAGGAIVGDFFFCWGKDVGFQFDANASGSALSHIGVDGDCTEFRSERIGYKFAAGATLNMLSGPSQTCGGFMVQNVSGGVAGQNNYLALGRAVGWTWGAVENDSSGIIIAGLQDVDNLSAGQFNGDVFSASGSLLSFVAGSQIPQGTFRSNVFATNGIGGLTVDNGSLLLNVGPTLAGPVSVNNNGIALTCSQTGGGAGATCLVGGDATPSGGDIAISAGTGAASSGTITLNFAASQPLTGQKATPVCVFALEDVFTAWSLTALAPQLTVRSATSITFNWNNNGTGLVNTDLYGIAYHCFGT
jgi:hypothetical protein